MMKCTIPEISWHNREPVLSVDIHPEKNPFYRLATGGGDCHVLIWQVLLENNGNIKQEVISDLKRHQRSVNVVKWSPSGSYLASGDDDANIILWQLKTDNIPSLDDDENNDKETWNVFKILRGHKEDIYDLCWSPDGSKLLSGSIDNTSIVWDLQKGKSEQIMTDHKGFVQGVAWDPKGQYLATISTDRICRIFDNTGKNVRARIHKGVIPVPSKHSLYEKEVKYFHDDTFKSFFRRLCFSPDGSILIVPSGHVVPEEGKTINCTFVFVVETNSPAALLPIPKQCSTVVACCPIYFELRVDGPKPYVNLPYRILFAIGTDHDIILYDTQQVSPFARFHNIHYTRLTDLTWSGDGLLLVASSTDGYCTMITFDPEELGIQHVKYESEIEESVANISLTLEPMEVAEIPTENPPKKEVPENPPVKKKEVPDKTIKVLTPRRNKRVSIPDKNPSILSFFKKADLVKPDNVEKSEIAKNKVAEQAESEIIVLNDDSLTGDENQVKNPNSVDVRTPVNCDVPNGNKCDSSAASALQSNSVPNREVTASTTKQPRRITPSRVS